MKRLACLAAVLLVASTGRQVLVGAAPSARDAYAAARGREQALHQLVASGERPPARSFRAVVAAYEGVVLRFPTCNCADSALWHAADVSEEAFGRFGDDQDRASARRLLAWLASQYPYSPRAAKARDRLAKPSPGATSHAPASPSGSAKPLVVLREVRRTVLADRVRVSLELSGRVAYRAGRQANPPRAVIDLPGTRLGSAVPDGPLTYPDGAVRHLRVARNGDSTRVEVELDRIARYSLSVLDAPFRLVLDCELERPSSPAPVPLPPPPTPIAGRTLLLSTVLAPTSEPGLEVGSVVPAHSPEGPGPTAPAAARPPAVESPATDATAPRTSTSAPHGSYSLARQLGLGASRVVIDAGHGGHDPGAVAGGVFESHIVLDVALRLEALLRGEGFDVVLTRRDDTFVPLEQRTAIANREQGDLFLSIHVNASRNPSIRGVESYVLNFATDPDAEAVAARENAATGRTMNALTDMVRAIALNSKLDESRSLAGFVERAMAARVDRVDPATPDHGVKQAPFVVLIGAAMPSVLVEISFLTNPQEAGLLRTDAYRQAIAEALADGLVAYQKSLKGPHPATR